MCVCVWGGGGGARVSDFFYYVSKFKIKNKQKKIFFWLGGR